jgi:hypothetical protein
LQESRLPKRLRRLFLAGREGARAGRDADHANPSLQGRDSDRERCWPG